ncbi:MAG: GGDEF domain-containing protein [Eubacteriaceae bacterium]|nr:GGDEF domain-containing protein [Eubacteriaceae bacterium]
MNEKTYEQIYEQCKDQIMKANRMMLMRVSLFFAALCVCIGAVVAKLYGTMPTLLMLVAAAIYAAVWVMARIYASKAPEIITPLIYFFLSVTFAIAMYQGIYASPNSIASTFYVVLVALPLLFICRLNAYNSFIIGVCALFMILSFAARENAIALNDSLHIGICAVLEVFVCYNMYKIRVEAIYNKIIAEEQRDIDGLTGLASRRKFDQLLGAFRDEDERITGIIMIDIDHFKKYNDYFGHLQGDECLTQIGKIMQEVGKEYDMVFARNGGEEFAGISKVYRYDQLASIAEEVRKRVEEKAIPHPGTKKGIVTLSIGFAEWRSCNVIDVVDLVKKADKALYYVKEHGRNSVCGFGSIAS